MMAEIVRPAWMDDQMWNVWIGHYLEAGGDAVAGSGERATELFRTDPQYTTWFPGIERPDGSIRYIDNPEQTYYENIQGYQNTVEGLKMAPEVFAEDYIDLIEGDVTVGEFTSRVNALEERVMAQGPGIRGYYSDMFGVDMTREGILASLMSKRVEDAVFNRDITMAEIGGEAFGSGYDLSAEFVELLAQEGMDRGDAQRTFGSAEALLPTLAALARRHADSDDDFSIEEFTEAAFLDDPTQMARINTLQAQEQAVFTGGAQLETVRSRATGGLSGLAET